MNKGILILISLSVILFSCKNGGDQQENGDGHGHEHESANEHMNVYSFDELVSFFEAPDRASWQQPTVVMGQMGPLEGKKVMDLGAGTGYFAFKLADLGANVIAADVDQRFIDYMASKKEEKGLTDEQLELRKVPYDDPALSEKEIDFFFTVNTWHHIENRVEYLKKVRHGLKIMEVGSSDLTGMLLIVDFKKEETPHGPPVTHRVDAETVKKELREAGFNTVVINSNMLKEQYIIQAFRNNIDEGI